MQASTPQGGPGPDTPELHDPREKNTAVRPEARSNGMDALRSTNTTPQAGRGVVEPQVHAGREMRGTHRTLPRIILFALPSKHSTAYRRWLSPRGWLAWTFEDSDMSPGTWNMTGPWSVQQKDTDLSSIGLHIHDQVRFLAPLGKAKQDEDRGWPAVDEQPIPSFEAGTSCGVTHKRSQY